MNKEINGLYAITDEDLLGKDIFSSAIQAVLDGGARIVQYRDKSADFNRRRAEAKIVVDACESVGALSIINDDVELAYAVNADGVHLGQSDQTLSAAREILGASAIIGISCYNRPELARDAASSGADYVAVGSIYPSSTKTDAISASFVDLAEVVETVQLPVVAIGGITLDKIPQLYSVGVSAIAAINAVFGDTPILELSDPQAENLVLESIREKALLFSQEWSRCEQI